MTSGVTAGFDVISFENMRLQAVYCIPVTRLLLGYNLMSQGQRSKATSLRDLSLFNKSLVAMLYADWTALWNLPQWHLHTTLLAQSSGLFSHVFSIFISPHHSKNLKVSVWSISFRL